MAPLAPALLPGLRRSRDEPGRRDAPQFSARPRRSDMRCTRRWLWLLALALAPVVPGTARANDTCANCSGNLVSCVEDARAEKLVCREDCKASRRTGGGAN